MSELSWTLGWFDHSGRNWVLQHQFGCSEILPDESECGSGANVLKSSLAE